MRMRQSITISGAVAALLAVMASCAPREVVPEAPDYSLAESWYVSDRGADMDIFYISSTETFDSAVGRRVYHHAQAADSACAAKWKGWTGSWRVT